MSRLKGGARITLVKERLARYQENVIARDFHADKPNKKWLTDITEFFLKTGKAYLSAVIHSDRGCHYRWSEWIRIVTTAGLTRSMSRKGCSPDNSACGGFFWAC